MAGTTAPCIRRKARRWLPSGMPGKSKHLDTNSDCSSAPNSTIENQDTNTLTEEVEVRDGKGTFVLKTCFLKKA
jgi:hypothetical protein